MKLHISAAILWNFKGSIVVFVIFDNFFINLLYKREKKERQLSLWLTCEYYGK